MSPNGRELDDFKGQRHVGQFGELSRARRTTRPFAESPLLAFNFLVFKAFNSVTFGEKPEFPECTRLLTEGLL
ncbi:hypothetical protein H5410_050334 [Solanum commersonii]|uniref:Uncharacterized protein n=1 Tax=Solanum commersonii TaxID=4109 RepID=A0A9J5WV58_SOLCO|nr:hypothetical protein H5410_050334 [Solanum commersonii]